MNDLVAPRQLLVAGRLGAAVAGLAAVAAAGGLFLPGLYRDTAWVVPQVRAQDLVTLLTLPVYAIALRAMLRGSARGLLVWMGLLGYHLYTWTGASFAYALNRFFLLYVALLSLSVATLVAVASGLDVRALQRRCGALPTRPVAAFLLFLALLLSALWLGQLAPFFLTGRLPEVIERAGNGGLYIYVLDLGLVVPLAILGAVWLRRGRPWGAVIAGALLIKAATMGLALLAMTAFALRAGQPADPGLAAAWLAIFLGSLLLAIRFFRACP